MRNGLVIQDVLVSECFSLVLFNTLKYKCVCTKDQSLFYFLIGSDRQTRGFSWDHFDVYTLYSFLRSSIVGGGVLLGKHFGDLSYFLQK